MQDRTSPGPAGAELAWRRVKLLIDAVMRQTTVLIAQLSTAAGIRAPLAHIADQVFLDLAAAIEEQGVRRKVAADMFGLALRTYQKKVQRLTSSVAERDRSLWEAVLDHLSERPMVSRRESLERFPRDPEGDLAAVLNDLVEQGLVLATGRLRPSSCPGGGPDLVLSTLAHCGERCPSNGAFYLFVGNAGTTAAAGPIRVAWSDDTGAGGIIEVSPGGLAPGEMTGMFTVPTDRSRHTEVAIDFEDCAPENGKFVDDYGSVICL